MGRKKFLTAAKLVFLLGSRQDGFGKLADNISLTQTAKEQNPPKTSPKELTFKNRIIKKMVSVTVVISMIMKSYFNILLLYQKKKIHVKIFF